jgi:hypothetical protein
MQRPDRAPQQPGSMVMHLEPGNAKVEIDGYPLDQFITAMTISFSRTTRKPVLSIELLPAAIDLTAPGVEINGGFRDFLVSHGWRPPE